MFEVKQAAAQVEALCQKDGSSSKRPIRPTQIAACAGPVTKLAPVISQDSKAVRVFGPGSGEKHRLQAVLDHSKGRRRVSKSVEDLPGTGRHVLENLDGDFHGNFLSERQAAWILSI
jgi:hypothetical protein